MLSLFRPEKLKKYDTKHLLLREIHVVNLPGSGTGVEGPPARTSRLWSVRETFSTHLGCRHGQSLLKGRLVITQPL